MNLWLKTLKNQNGIGAIGISIGILIFVMTPLPFLMKPSIENSEKMTRLRIAHEILDAGEVIGQAFSRARDQAAAGACPPSTTARTYGGVNFCLPATLCSGTMCVDFGEVTVKNQIDIVVPERIYAALKSNWYREMRRALESSSGVAHAQMFGGVTYLPASPGAGPFNSTVTVPDCSGAPPTPCRRCADGACVRVRFCPPADTCDNADDATWIGQRILFF